MADIQGFGNLFNLTYGMNSQTWADTTPCALVMEDEPVPGSRLTFQTFPGEIEENYSVESYQAHGGKNMPQPLRIAYRGGNWQPFTLELKFSVEREYNSIATEQNARSQTAIERTGSTGAGSARRGVNSAASRVVSSRDADLLNTLLLEMEKKVRWCQALAFPLLGLAASRVFGSRLRASGRADAMAQRLGLGTEEGGADFLGGIPKPYPPMVLVVFGSWWVQRAYVQSVTVKWQGPWHPVTVRPYNATVTLSMQPLKVQYPYYDLIRNQANRGGMDSPLISGPPA